MKLTRIEYTELTAKQKEIYNFQKVAALLADYGFNCIKLADDWQGADFLAYHKDGRETLKVQLKSRLSIAEKYVGKDLYMTFPIDGEWYLIGHDDLLNAVANHTNWLNTDSWIKDQLYSTVRPNKLLIESMKQYCL